MTRLAWNSNGARRFETGVDRGVLYTSNGVGVPWNGLTSVNESSSGGETAPYYLDGLKYLEVPSREEFGGTIEAFTYPDEFGIHDGTITLSSGLIAHQQKRRPFGLSYRTLVGNDEKGAEYGYKIHLVYNALAKPSAMAYATRSDSTDPSKFSWEFTTTPKRPKADTKLAPLAHVTIDSTKTDPNLMRFIEEQLYGSVRRDAEMVSLDALFRLFENPTFILSILANRVTGLSQLNFEIDGDGDLIGNPADGLYEALSETRLIPTGVTGYYKLASLSDSPAKSMAYNPASGLFELTSGGSSDLLSGDEGFYTIPNGSRLTATGTPGIYRLES